ncbi:MAG: hypothetical protein R3C05_26215 [Pirellulaceae bacterium]
MRLTVQQAGITQFGSLDNLFNAYGMVYRYLLDNYGDQGSLKKLWGYLANNVSYSFRFQPMSASALKIFETINERGAGLEPDGPAQEPAFHAGRAEGIHQTQE